MLDDLSYLAGLVDGEGHLAISSRGRTRPGTPIRRQLVIEIKMTEEKIIDWLQANYGGAKQFYPSKNPRWKDQWRWRVVHKEAWDLYERLRPLLKIKNSIELRSPISTDRPHIKRSRLDRNRNRAHE